MWFCKVGAVFRAVLTLMSSEADTQRLVAMVTEVLAISDVFRTESWLRCTPDVVFIGWCAAAAVTNSRLDTAATRPARQWREFKLLMLTWAKFSIAEMSGDVTLLRSVLYYRLTNIARFVSDSYRLSSFLSFCLFITYKHWIIYIIAKINETFSPNTIYVGAFCKLSSEG